MAMVFHAKTVERAAANKYEVIITVDNGITAFDAAQAAKKVGIDLIITDHHRAHGKCQTHLQLLILIKMIVRIRLKYLLVLGFHLNYFRCYTNKKRYFAI